MKRNVTVLAVLLLLVPALLLAQARTTGGIRGTVVDESGAPIADANATVTSQALGIERTDTTNQRGEFFFLILPTGYYELMVSKVGMQPQLLDFRLSVGEQIPLTVTMLPGEAVTEALTVLGAPSVMATTSTGETLDYEGRVEELPIQIRTLESVAGFAPNIAAGPTAGTLSISGAPSFDTVVLLDGAEISDPYFGSAPIVYLEDALEEVQILTSGVSARYGRFQGGIINGITKSGSNQYEATIRAEFQQEDWDQQTPFGEDQSDDLEEAYQGTAGGYVLKDRFFWFGGVRAVPESGTVATTVQSRESYTSTEDQDRWQFKLRGAPTSNHLIDVSKLDFESTISNRAGLPAGDLGATNGDRLDPRETTTVAYQGVLSPSLFLDVQGTEKQVSIQSGGNPAGLDPIFTLSPFAFWTNHWWDVSDASVRDNETAAANLTYAISTEKAGSHVIEGGVQYVSSTTGGENRQSATGFNAILVSGSSPSFAGFGPDGQARFNLLPFPQTVSLRWEALPLGGQNEIEDRAAYVQDTISLGKWRFDVGLRLDDYQSSSPFAFQNFSFSELAPRLGVAYNIDPTWQILATYGRYVSRFNDGPFGNATGIGSAPLIETLYLGPAMPGATAAEFGAALHNDAFWPVTTALTDPNQPTIFISSDITSPYATDLTFGLRKALPRNRGSVSLTYVNREYEELLDDFVGGVCSDFGLSFNNPSGGCDFTTAFLPDPTDFDTTVWDNNPSAVREYESVGATFEYRPSTRLAVFGSTTFSETQGNYEGEAQNQPASGTILGDFVRGRPEANAAPYGFLDEDVTARATGGASYAFDFGRAGRMVVGATGIVQSGERWSQTASVDVADDPLYLNDVGQSYTHFFDGRGQNRFRDWWALNGSVRYEIPLYNRLDFWVKVSALNVTGETEVIQFDTESATAQMVNGILTWVPDGSCGPTGDSFPSLDCSGFGEIRNEDDFQLPRTWLLTIGLDF